MEDQVPAKVPIEGKEQSVTDIVPSSSSLNVLENQDAALLPQKRERIALEEVRCIAWKKTCDCGHHFSGKDLYGGKSKLKSNRIQGTPPACPMCGRPRQRCKRKQVAGTPCCRKHGGKGIARRAFIPGYSHMDDEKILTLETMMEEDDTTLRREFHMLRIYFGDAIQQFEKALELHKALQEQWEAVQEKEGASVLNILPIPVDLIGEAHRLAGMIDKLSSISEKRNKIHELPNDQLVRVQFEDPRVKYVIKEVMHDMEIKTIKQVVAVMLTSLDPTGELGLIERLPASFIPYLPPLPAEMEVPNASTGTG